MNAVLRRRLERAARVRDFIRAHKTDGTGEGTALARLEELLQRAEALAAQQRSGVVATRSATLQRRELRHALQTKLLKYLAAVGAVAAKGNTELAPQFRLPPTGASHPGVPHGRSGDAREGERAEGAAREPRRDGPGGGWLVPCRAFLSL